MKKNSVAKYEDETSHYDAIIRRQIDSGRASNKTEFIHQALTLLDALTRGKCPGDATFTNAVDLEELLLAGLTSGPASAMTTERKARIYGRLKR